jgi:hypothetical protein
VEGGLLAKNEAVSDSALNCRILFFCRRMQKNMKADTRIRNSPPTAPPAIAATGVDRCGEGDVEGDEVVVDEKEGVGNWLREDVVEEISEDVNESEVVLDREDADAVVEDVDDEGIEGEEVEEDVVEVVEDVDEGEESSCTWISKRSSVI